VSEARPLSASLGKGGMGDLFGFYKGGTLKYILPYPDFNALDENSTKLERTNRASPLTSIKALSKISENYL
jgi:hypothetical protein